MSIVAKNAAELAMRPASEGDWAGVLEASKRDPYRFEHGRLVKRRDQETPRWRASLCIV